MLQVGNILGVIEIYNSKQCLGLVVIEDDIGVELFLMLGEGVNHPFLNLI